MKRAVAMMLVCVMALGMTACTGAPTNSEKPNDSQGNNNTTGPVTLEVVTTYAGNDGNAQNFKDAVAQWEKSTKNNIIDMSATADEAFKTRVSTDFETGSEPDVLFFFTGADADSFVKDGKVMTIDEIRAQYPNYASNMDDARLPISTADGKKYAVPVNGYWEGLFVNKTVLEAAGVTMPGADYTWDAFLADCQKIKDAGKTPIAAALGHIPHYWWEFSIFNHTTPATHVSVPESVDSEGGKAWVAGMNDIKQLYEKGFFPERTNTMKDDESVQMFINDEAAFLIDGSWKIGGIVAECQKDEGGKKVLDEEKLAKFAVTYVPSNGGERKATDLIGGISSGYYITKKCWEDPAKREAAVDFITKMTTDDVVSKFARTASTALKNGVKLDAKELNTLEQSAIEMVNGSTALVGAVQDIFAGDCRVSTFEVGMPKIVTGKVSAEDAVKEGLDAYAAQQKK